MRKYPRVVMWFVPVLQCGQWGKRPYAYELCRGQTTKRASELRDKDVERRRAGAARRAAEKGLASLAAASMLYNVRTDVNV